MTLTGYIIKRKIEGIFIFPFILVGRLIAFAKPLKTKYRIFYFFPFFHIGGAEKVHYQVAQATGGKDCVIFFTRKSHNKLFFSEFEKSGCTIRDISSFTDNKWLYFLNLIYRGIISGHINKQTKDTIVFNGQCNFGYKISPWVNKSFPQIELIHALNTFSYIRIPFISFYRACITVSDEIIARHKQLYKNIRVPDSFWNKFCFITSKVELPGTKITGKKYNENPIVILYVGRGTVEKRPQIASLLAKRIISKGLSARFEFAGDVQKNIPDDQRSFCFFYGDVSNETELGQIYHNAHVLLIPSSTESGPLVFMEAMARGVAIISTPVGYIPEHIHNYQSGFVTTELYDEEMVVEEMEVYIEKLIDDRDLLTRIGEFNIRYAYDNFDLEGFKAEYRQLFNSINNNA